MNTLTKGLKLSDLSSMDADSKERAVDDFFQSDPISSTEIDEEIRGYELKYGITSEQMLKEVGTGKFSTYPDICSWLMVLKIKHASKS